MGHPSTRRNAHSVCSVRKPFFLQMSCLVFVLELLEELDSWKFRTVMLSLSDSFVSDKALLQIHLLGCLYHQRLRLDHHWKRYQSVQKELLVSKHLCHQLLYHQLKHQLYHLFLVQTEHDLACLVLSRT